MSYPCIDKSAGEKLLSAYRDDGIYDANRYVKLQGSGENEVDGVKFRRLHDELRAIFVGPRPKGEAQDAYFEMMACSVVHRALDKLSIAAASDPKFWLWLTFASAGKKMVDLVTDRFKKGEKIPADVNFGITTGAYVYDGLYARLWWRGYRFFDETAQNPYELAERGDIDFWRSHILDQKFSQADCMTKAFIKFILPEHKKSSGWDTPLMRGVAKKLKARYTSCCFESLEEDQCNQILTDLASEVREKQNEDAVEGGEANVKKSGPAKLNKKSAKKRR